MSITSLPGLNLSLKKHKSTHTATTSNASSSSNNNNVITINFPERALTPVFGEPKAEVEPTLAPGKPDKSGKILKPLAVEPAAASPVESPKDVTSIDFMKALIRIQTEMFLDNIMLLNNLRDLGNKVIYRVEDLKEMIEILTGVTDINIDTDEVPVMCGCKIPIYAKIKSIALNKTNQFLTSDIATRLREEFKISLEFAILPLERA
jgi:hypothetical protein